jgi:2,4-dienoyl-CoA reductase-like NADH-dependent reductase (Old Yellow Enzyme family)
MTRKLFEPIEIHGMRLKNRVGFAPILGMPVDPDGAVNEETIRWFEDRAKGGAGFIMTGTIDAMSSDNYSKNAPVRPETGACIYDDKFIPGWKKLIEVIHAYKVKIGAQLAAPGPMMAEGPSPSPYPDPSSPKFGVFDLMAGTILPVQEVSAERLEILKSFLSTAAGRVKDAGFDCVELHCGHGGANLHASFLSPYYNRRTDKYGGSWENRTRLIVETVAEMRKVVGDNYPILVRFSVDELLGDKGITIDDSTKKIIPILEQAGVNAIDVSQGSVTHSMQGPAIPLYYPRGCFLTYAETIKKATKLPVIGVGRILDFNMGELVLEQGKADILYLGSQLMADPETPKKYFENRADEIRKCIGCKPIFCGTPCTINYDSQVGRKPLVKAQTQKKVLIIGGGVGGMEAARIASLRGHQVTLMEKEPELGGNVAAMSHSKLTAEFKNIVDYLSVQMKKLKVDVRVCKEAVLTDVDELKPDVVIVACGSSMAIPELGQNKPGVVDYFQACKNLRAIGQRVVVWGLAGAELAISLAEEGKTITLIGKGSEKALGGQWAQGPRQFYLFRKLTDIPLARETNEAQRVQNPRVYFGVTVKGIEPAGMEISDKEGAEKILPYDSIIVCLQRKANDFLYDKLQGKAPELYKIGDCDKPIGIKEAIWSANGVAREI